MNQKQNAIASEVFSGDFNHAVHTLSRRNPGAVKTILRMVAAAVQIDPQAWGKELHPIMELDNLGIRGSEIHGFMKYTCNNDLITAFAMFRAVQLGFLPKSILLAAIADERPVVNCEQLVAQVRVRLPRFGDYLEAADASAQTTQAA